MMMPPNPGTRRTPRAAKREAARRSTYAAPVAMGCSIVSRPTSQTYKIPKQGAGKSVDYPRLAGVYCFFSESVVFSTGRGPKLLKAVCVSAG